MKMKRFLTAICALTAAAMLAAVSAGAVDYSDRGTPTTPLPSNNTTVTPPTAADEDASSGDTAAPSVITDAGMSEVLAEAAQSGQNEITVTAQEDEGGNVTVQEAAIAELANSDVTVTFEIKSDEGTEYEITIDPSTITEAKPINLAMVITVAEEDTSSAEDYGAGAVMIKPAQKGDFGMTLQVTIPAKKVEDIDPSKARLYYISDSGEITKMSKNSLKVNADGSFTIAISHASEYVISDIDITKNGISTVTNDDYEEPIDDTEDDPVYDVVDSDDVPDISDDTIVTDSDDLNPGTGAAVGALGAFAASAVAAAVTAAAKRRR